MRLGTILSILAIAPAAISCGRPGVAASAAHAAGDQTRTVNQRTGTRAPAPASRSPLALANPSGSALFNAAYHRTGNDWEQAIFLCDGVDGDRVKVVSTPNARGLSELWTYRKRDFGTSHETVRLGDEDPGAGQIMRELRHPGGVAMGSIHSINPGMVGDARATTLPTLSSIAAGGETTRCRWTPRARLLFVDERRTVLVTSETNGSFTYRSFDHARPGKAIGTSGNGSSSFAAATVRGGRVKTQAGVETYEFDAEPWRYRLAASADNRSPGATLTVLKLGRTVSTSTAVAYEMAAARRD